MVQEHYVEGRVEYPPDALKLAQIEGPPEVGRSLEGIESCEAVQNLCTAGAGQSLGLWEVVVISRAIAFKCSSPRCRGHYGAHCWLGVPVGSE